LDAFPGDVDTQHERETTMSADDVKTKVAELRARVLALRGHL